MKTNGIMVNSKSLGNNLMQNPWMYLWRKYTAPFGFHLTNLFILTVLNLLYINLEIRSLEIPFLKYNRVIVPFFLYLLPLLRHKWFMVGENKDVLSFEYLHLWVLTIGLTTAIWPVFEITSEPIGIGDKIMRRVPNIFLSLFIMVLSYFLSKLLSKQDDVLETITNEILPDIDTASQKLDALSRIGDNLVEHGKSFEEQTIELKRIQKEIISINVTQQAQHDFLEAMGASKNRDRLYSFHAELNETTGKMFNVITGNLKSDEITLVLCLLFSRYLSHSFRNIKDNAVSFKTTFANYADIVRELIEAFYPLGKYDFYTLLILSPGQFFNLYGEFSNKDWLSYIDYNLRNIAISERYRFRRYFLTCSSNLNCAEHNCRETASTPDKFQSELKSLFIFTEDGFPKYIEKSALIKKEGQVIENRQQKLSKALAAKELEKLDQSNRYDGIPDTAQGFHIIDQKDLDYVQDSSSYISLNTALSMYHQNNEFCVFVADPSICDASSLPLDTFAIKNDKGEWLLAIGIKGTDIDSEHITLSLYYPNSELWPNMKERLDTIFIDPDDNRVLDVGVKE